MSEQERTRTFICEDPTEGTKAGGEISGLEYLRVSGLEYLRAIYSV